MSDGIINQISTSIQEKLGGLSETSNEQCIFKVHDGLRNQNEEAYEPKILSIGPYHRGKSNLKSMETYKLRYLQELLSRKHKENANDYISALVEVKENARRCYAERITLTDADFVEMLCLDGLFIIEFLRKLHKERPSNRNDTERTSNKDDKIFRIRWLCNTILRDLILFENQIPSFVLDKLFALTKDGGESLNKLATHLCKGLIKGAFGKVPSPITTPAISGVKHLLEFTHQFWCSCFANNFDSVDDYKMEIIKSASELGQSGIKFGSAEQNASAYHITFEDGKIKIPHLTVDIYTERTFRNLIAFEQYMLDPESSKPVTDYARFLDHLIETPSDVEKLRHCHIITNRMGDDQLVATMFNKLALNLIVREHKFCYLRVYKEVNGYSNKRWNIWKAHLMMNYFNSPWSVISFLAAVVLLILTAVQTIFSIL